MVKMKNDCVGLCPQGCIGRSCIYKDVPRLYCDKCREESEKLYTGGDGDELCESCAKDEMLKIVADFDIDELCEITDFHRCDNRY